MQTNILWQGLLYNSLENCLVETTNAGTTVNAVIVGLFDNKIYKIEYLIKATQQWETVCFEIRSQFANRIDHRKGERDSERNWIIDEKPAEAFKGCMDIDISLTPFTNTLPINRLQLPQHAGQIIDVVYIDVLERQIKRAQQRYTRLSETEYKYENIPNDFEAVLSVDGQGFVRNYPGLFLRNAAIAASYAAT